MATNTINYNLVKPDLNETADIEVINENMDIIDEAFTNISTIPKATGTATAITLTVPTLVNGYSKTFIASANNNSAATTINTKPLYKPNTTVAPTLITGKAYTVWYNLAGDCFFIKASAEGTATTAQVLAGVPFSNETDTGLMGTMHNYGGVVYEVSTGEINSMNAHPVDANAYQINYNIPIAGFVDSTTLFKCAVSNLNPTTIKAGTKVGRSDGTITITGTYTSDANAGAGDIISPKTAYVNGVKVSGTMPNRAGDTAALASSISGTTLKLLASEGYRNGVEDNVTITDPNFIPANINDAVSMFNLQGTLKKVVSAVSDTNVFAAVNQLMSHGTLTMLKVCETTIMVDGTYRISYNLGGNGGQLHVYAQIYKNDVAYGVYRDYYIQSVQTRIAYTEDLTFNAGDKIQLYTQSGFDGFDVEVDYFKVYSSIGSAVSIYH